VIAGLTNAACYRYVPVSLGGVQSKEDVRVRVSDATALRLSDQLGAISTEIDGQIAPQGADSVAVAVPIARTYRGTTIGTSTQVLLLRPPGVVDVRKREFSRSRTVLLAAGTVVGFAGLAVGITQLVDPNGPPDNSTTPPPPPALRRPWGLSVRIPIP